MKLFQIGKWRFSLTFNMFFLERRWIYSNGFRFIFFEVYYTDLNGWITFCNIRFKWDKYFKKEK